MIFPFKIIKKYKLPNSDFEEYTNEEIVDRIYNNLTPLKFKFIKKENYLIELKGDKNKWYFYLAKPDLTSHCIDKGFIELIDSKNNREIKYTYQILHLPIYMSIITGILPTAFGLFFNSMETGLLFLKVLLVVNILIWIFLIFTHPLMVGSTLEKYRYETIRKRNLKNNNCYQQVISHSRIAVIKTKNCKFENKGNQHKSE